MKRCLPPVLIAFLWARYLFADSGESIDLRIKRQPVASSNLTSVGYSHRLRVLAIEFGRGTVYRYFDVPPGIHDELMAAKSKGHYLAVNILGKYPFVRVYPHHPHFQPISP